MTTQTHIIFGDDEGTIYLRGLGLHVELNFAEPGTRYNPDGTGFLAYPDAMEGIDGRGATREAAAQACCDRMLALLRTPAEMIAVPVGVEPPGWAWHDPEMGAVAHDITWHSGHVSSSATVCDLYLADASLLLTVITPAHQQAHNLAEIGTAAYAPGDRSP